MPSAEWKGLFSSHLQQSHVQGWLWMAKVSNLPAWTIPAAELLKPSPRQDKHVAGSRCWLLAMVFPKQAKRPLQRAPAPCSRLRKEQIPRMINWFQMPCTKQECVRGFICLYILLPSEALQLRSYLQKTYGSHSEPLYGSGRTGELKQASKKSPTVQWRAVRIAAGLVDWISVRLGQCRTARLQNST